MFLTVAFLALVLAAWALATALKAKNQLGRIQREQAVREERTNVLLEELRGGLRNHGRLLLRASQGKPVSRGQALDGRPFDDIEGETAWQLLDTNRRVTLVDVRDPHEYSAGHIPGALWIPLSQLEQRWREVPQDADYVIIHCAAGSRSAAACEYLSREHGYLNLYNLTGGLSAWPGPVETGRG